MPQFLISVELRLLVEADNEVAANTHAAIGLSKIEQHEQVNVRGLDVIAISKEPYEQGTQEPETPPKEEGESES